MSRHKDVVTDVTIWCEAATPEMKQMLISVIRGTLPRLRSKRSLRREVAVAKANGKTEQRRLEAAQA